MNVLIREKCESSEEASDWLAGWKALDFFILGYYAPQEKSVFGIFRVTDGPSKRGQTEVGEIVVKASNMRSQK